MSGKRIGYIRVSTVDQNPDRQLVDVELDKKFIDYASASSTNRPNLKLMLDFIREDDIVFVHSMDRLARNVVDLRNLVNHIVSKGAQVHFKKENLVFNGSSDAMASLLLSLMGALAEFELSFIKERQREGIFEAKKKGKYAGRKSKLNDEMAKIIIEKMKGRESKLKIAKSMGVTPTTFYNYLRKLNIPL